jgi:hypothetical protein
LLPFTNPFWAVNYFLTIKLNVMKKEHLKVLVRTLTETQIQMKAAHKLTEQVLNNKILYYKEKVEEEKKHADMWRQSYSVDSDKLDAAIKAKDHYYGRVKTLKASLERQET